MSKSNTDSKKRRVNKRSAQQRAAARKLTSRIIVGVLVAFALLSIIFIFVTTNFMGSDNLVTEVAEKTIVNESINTTGFVIRDEEYISNDTKGVLVYQVSNGDKIAVKGTIATIYKNETDAVNYQKICRLDEEISELTELNNIMGSSNVGLDSVNNRLDQKLTTFIQNVNMRDFNNITNAENELISAIYRKQIITGDQENFDEKIAELEDEKAQLENSSGDSIGEIIAKHSGYFSSNIDGYENTFSIDDLSQIKYSDIKDVEPDDKIKGTDFVGKVLKGVNWYLACPVSDEQAVAINHNNSAVNVRIPYATNESIPARVVSVNQFSNEEKAIVVLECNYMSPAISQIRNEGVEILLNTYEGLKVSKKALHDDYVTKTVYDENGNKKSVESKVQGVYVKYGNQLLFKQVFIVYSAEDYVICSENPSSDVLFNGSTLALYDEVVVEGDDLFDGKLID